MQMFRSPERRVSLRMPATQQVDRMSTIEDKFRYEMSDVEKEICEKVERTHPQMFPAIDFALVLTLARLGLIQLGPKGLGKSTAQNALVDSVKGIEWIRADPGFTPAYVGNEESGLLDVLATRPVEVVIDDLTAFFTSSTTLTSFQFISQLSYAKSWFGRVRGQPVIPHTDFSALSAGTYWCCARAVELGIWDSHVVDRFIRLYPIYYKHPLDINDFVTAQKGNPKFDFDYVPVPYNSMGWAVSFDMEKRCIEMLRHQVTERRAVIYTRDILMAHAWLCGREYVTDDDAKWLLLYHPWIVIESLFIHKKVVDVSGVKQSAGLVYSDVPAEILFWIAFRKTTPEDLKRITRYKQAEVNEVVLSLQRMGLIQRDVDGLSLTPIFQNSIERLFRYLGGEEFG
jgi:hypothetical protein